MVRRREDDDLRTKGVAKFFHNIFLFITFPLRKPVKFVLIFLFLFMLAHIPVYTHNVKKEELLDWYKEKITPIIDSVSDKISSIKSEYFPTEKKKKTSKKAQKKAKNTQKSHKNSAVENYTKRYNQQTAEKRIAEYSGDEADRIYQYRMEEYENSAIHNTGRKNPYYGTPSRFNLSYPQEVLEVSGIAEIVNANELIVSGVHMFLFGIYTDPQSGNYEYGAKFLREETSDKAVRCEILAYSAQNVATANCYVGVKSLNDGLVSLGIARLVL